MFSMGNVLLRRAQVVRIEYQISIWSVNQLYQMCYPPILEMRAGKENEDQVGSIRSTRCRLNGSSDIACWQQIE